MAIMLLHSWLCVNGFEPWLLNGLLNGAFERLEQLGPISGLSGLRAESIGAFGPIRSARSFGPIKSARFFGPIKSAESFRPIKSAGSLEPIRVAKVYFRLAVMPWLCYNCLIIMTGVFHSIHRLQLQKIPTAFTDR